MRDDLDWEATLHEAGVECGENVDLGALLLDASMEVARLNRRSDAAEEMAAALDRVMHGKPGNLRSAEQKAMLGALERWTALVAAENGTFAPTEPGLE